MTPSARITARRGGWLTAALALGFFSGPRAVQAQAWSYPAFQQSHIVNREFNFGVANGGDPGTSLLVQWREQTSSVEQISFDLGAAFNSGQSAAFVGFQYGYQFINQSSQTPIELLGVTGLNLAFVSHDVLLRVPVGASIGHAFHISPNQSITPFILPRVELDFCTECGGRGSGRAELNVNSDFGLNMDVSPQWSIRVAANIESTTFFDHDPSFGISVAWRPPGLRH